MDKEVASLLRELEDEGLAENTIVFFWGDHGRGLPRGKRWAYDSGLRVPLIMRWAGNIKPGSTRDDLVTLMDLAPTLISIAGKTPPKQMQGRVILGKDQQKAPEYVFATRDRMDETSDMIRSARDEDYRYIKNFHPDRPYSQSILYMDKMPILQEWRRLAKEGKLNPVQSLFFAKEKPAEELYDEQNDPYEIHNLASSPKHQKVLERMRAATQSWMRSTHDMGMTPEDVLTQRWRPGGEQPVTAPPEILMRGADFEFGTQIALQSPTEGASIAYTFEPGPNPHWLLYTKAIPLTRSGKLRAKAIRIGYKESPELVQDFVRPGTLGGFVN